MDQTYTQDLTIILPAYKEAENLNILLPRLHHTLSQTSLSYEIFIVDTIEAMDNALDISNLHGATYMNREGDNSYGSAIKTGIKHARGAKTIFMDSDGSHTPEFILNMLPHRHQYDVVIASRYIKGGQTENSLPLIFMSLVLNITYALVLNLKIKDVSNSFKLYDTLQLQSLKLQCQNFDIVEEIIYKLNLKNKNLKVLELPFTFKKRMFGETKRNLFLFIMNYVFTMVKLKRMNS